MYCGLTSFDERLERRCSIAEKGDSLNNFHGHLPLNLKIWTHHPRQITGTWLHGILNVTIAGDKTCRSIIPSMKDLTD